MPSFGTARKSPTMCSGAGRKSLRFGIHRRTPPAPEIPAGSRGCNLLALSPTPSPQATTTNNHRNSNSNSAIYPCTLTLGNRRNLSPPLQIHHRTTTLVIKAWLQIRESNNAESITYMQCNVDHTVSDAAEGINQLLELFPKYNEGT